jgi:hypothetical protein
MIIIIVAVVVIIIIQCQMRSGNTSRNDESEKMSLG